VRCDALGCAMPLPEGGRIAVPRLPEAVPDDCHEARVIVTRFAVPATCRAQVIHTHALAWTGAVRLFRTGDSYRVETARAEGSSRPWFRPRPSGDPPPLVRTATATPTNPAPADSANEIEFLPDPAQ
jgi:competence protein ComEC